MASNELPITEGDEGSGTRVRVFRREGRSNLYIRCWDPTKGQYKVRSLGHSDLDKAAEKAADLHAELVKGQAVDDGPLTVARLLARYRRHKSPEKGGQAQGADKRRARLWSRQLGSQTAVRDITTGQWEEIIAKRRRGAIDARGRSVPEEDRVPVGDRAIQADCLWLKSAAKWAASYKTSDDYLLKKNPLTNSDAFKVPSEDNPTRIAATEARYRATLAVSDNVHPFLTTLLVLANETGHRIGAIRHLRYSDLLLDAGRHGKIRWRSEHDKMDHDHARGITAQAREALDAHLSRLPGTGNAWIFPHPEKAGEPITRWYPNKWLQAAEDAAGLEPLDGKLWHAYRAKFATELLDAGASPVHVMKLGGWTSVETVLEIYGQPSDDMLQEALERRHGVSEPDPVEEAADLLGVDQATLSEALQAVTASEREAA